MIANEERHGCPRGPSILRQECVPREFSCNWSAVATHDWAAQGRPAAEARARAGRGFGSDRVSRQEWLEQRPQHASGCILASRITVGSERARDPSLPIQTCLYELQFGFGALGRSFVRIKEQWSQRHVVEQIQGPLYFTEGAALL